MQYEKYTFWLLLVFAVSVSAAAYWAHKKVSDAESTLNKKVEKVEGMAELVMASLPNIGAAAKTLETYQKAFTDAGFGNPTDVIDLVKNIIPPTNPPVYQSAQPKILTRSAPSVTYRIGRA
jgi:hypothetical protein